MRVHMLWIGERLSQIEQMSCKSYLKHGFEVNLWAYDDVRDVPEGVELKDANEVLPARRIFTYRNGSYAGYANLFRYAVLTQFGGLWSDIDILCLRDVDEIDSGPFLVLEQGVGKKKMNINNCLIHCPFPERGDIVDLAFAVADRYNPDLLSWGDTGPKLLTTLHAAYPKVRFPLKRPSFCNFFEYTQCPTVLLKQDKSSAAMVMGMLGPFLHLYNETWRRAGVDKQAPFPKGSLMDILKQRYL